MDNNKIKYFISNLLFDEEGDLFFLEYEERLLELLVIYCVDVLQIEIDNPIIYQKLLYLLQNINGTLESIKCLPEDTTVFNKYVALISNRVKGTQQAATVSLINIIKNIKL